MLTPRPLPDRRLPVTAGWIVVLLALPVFLAAGWPLAGWGLGAALWTLSQLVAFVLGRRGVRSPTLRGSGPMAFGMMGRGILLMAIAIVVAAIAPKIALAGAVVYAAAYTTELVLSLTVYFQGNSSIAAPPGAADRGQRR